MDPGSEQTFRAESSRLSEFIRAHEREILQEWEGGVRALPKARELEPPALLDHMPELLEAIATSADLAPGGGERLSSQLAEAHALERLSEGFDLTQVAAELFLLRDCVLRLWETEFRGGKLDSTGLRALHEAIDEAVCTSIDRYTRARERTLQSLDRISAAALEAHNLDEFLRRLLLVLLETTEVVDTATILLREGNRLVVRASVGLEPEVATGFSVEVGEGFAGTIAKSKQPLTLRSAATDPLVRNPSLRGRGVKGVHGVPLMDRGEAIGVAHMGSLTAHEFSDEDKRLLSTLATRATAAILQHLLREDAEQRARQQEALVAFEHRLPGLGGTSALLDDAVRVTANVLGVEFASILELRADGTFELEAGHGWDSGTRRVGALPVTEQARYAVKTGRPVVVDDLRTDERFQFSTPLDERQIRSSLSVPVRVSGEPEATFGVLGAHALRLRAFSSDDVRFVEGIAAALGAALALRRSERDRARLLEKAQKDRAEAERALAEIDALLSSSLVGIGFVDRELRYVRVNDALAAFNERPAADHLGRTVREVLGDKAGGLEPLLRAVIDSGKPIANLELMSAPSAAPDERRSFLGNYFPVVTPSGETLGVGAAVIEITDRARAEAALRASEERVKRALSIQTVGVLFFSLDGRFLDANRALQRMCGYTREELRNMKWQALTPPEFEAATAQTAEQLATTGEAAPYEKQWIRPDGSRWWGLSAATRLSESGSASQCAEFIIDISERKQAEEALRAAIRAREEVLAVVSHDLRNPLGAVHMSAGVLARKLSPDRRVRKHVETIQRSASRMDHLIGDLLDMASIQVGRLAVERKPENPDLLVTEAILSHEPSAKEKGVSIVRRVCGLQGWCLSCDRERILQVLGNLIGNAIKFCRVADVITIHGELVGKDARLSVCDTGPGIPEDELPHVFEPYWSAQRHAKKGTGLGLYISKGIVEAHGGHLWVESKSGGGAAFHFTLPTVNAEDQ